MDEIDPAALRRFTFKVRFDYLTAEQSRKMLLAVLQELGVAASDLGDAIAADLASLSNLTPGDFAVAARQARLLGTTPTSQSIIRVLEDESREKLGKHSRQVGFCR
jgi:transitional endoplasmic reticulum ATPase